MKARIWDGKEFWYIEEFKALYYPENHGYSSASVAIIGGKISSTFGNYGRELKDSIMFGLGFKDQEGNEIYEGDIVIADWHWTKPHIIEFPRDVYAMYEFSMNENCKIIGNIHNTLIDSEGDPII